MSKTRTPDRDHELDNRQCAAMYRLQLLTRLANEAVQHATPGEETLDQWELLTLFEMQGELLVDLEAIEAERTLLENDRYMSEHPELLGKRSKQGVQ
jgi:hypothetical protein